MSRNIAKIGEFKDHIFYRAICECTSEICDLELSLKYDSNQIILEIGGNFSFDRSSFRNYNFIQRLYKWMKSVIRLIFAGHIEVGTDFIFGSEDQIQDFISELQTGLDKIKQNMGK